ncbi:MAG: hypothetical protein Q9159_007031 [Coniocarpon cinnabarinum]
MSQGFKDMVKGGWVRTDCSITTRFTNTPQHPDKNKSQSFSVRQKSGTVNRVAGWTGHGKKDDIIDTSNHSAAPLSTLRDPASFGPPPKHVAAHGSDAASESVRPSPRMGTTPSIPARGSQPSPAKAQTWSPSLPGRQGSEESTPPVPSRAGLSPSPAPGRVQSPLSAAAKKPSLPPRLPPRRDTGEEGLESPPPPYEEAASLPQEQPSAENGYVNRAASSRLGKAGVSVPGFGIGSNTQSSTGTPRASNPSTSQMNELSTRFGKMGRNPSSDAASATPSTGTSWSQKQAAFKTADSFRKDPASVSMSDARSAASTANNFRQRHGEQVAAGVNRANDLNQRYGGGSVSAGAGAGAAGNTTARQTSEYPGRQASVEDGREEDEDEEEAERRRRESNVPSTVAGKKKPPPPPAKKSSLAMGHTGAGGSEQGPESPPPIPLASKPR